MKRGRCVVSDGVVFEVVAGEAIILDLSTGTYYRLNEIATELWSSIVAHGSPDPGIEHLLTNFSVEPAQARCDAVELVSSLARHGLITRSDSSGGRDAPGSP